MWIGLLVIRLAVGLTLAAHGAQKFGAFGGRGLDATGAFFESLGFRPGRRHAEMAAVTELVAGLMLATGLLTPVASAAIVGVMLVAAISAHGANGFFVTRGGFEYAFVLAAVAAGIAFTGPGPVSVDWLLDLDVRGPLWGGVAIVFGAGAAIVQLSSRRTDDQRDVDLREGEPAGRDRVRR